MLRRILAFWCALQLAGGLQYKHDYRGFDDMILFDIEWPGLAPPLTDSQLVDHQAFKISSTLGEEYKCYLPPMHTSKDNKQEPYTGPSPYELLMPLLNAGSCSYRIESYWTYEVCHGTYIKQYHEDRTRIHEYYLGKYLKAHIEMIMKDRGESSDPIPRKKIEGTSLPYYEIEMTDGTMCDLNNELRKTNVLYVCYAHGKNEIYSLKETSICNYEVIILTPTLCSHPLFKPEESNENKIICQPLNEETPKKPVELEKLEAVPTTPTLSEHLTSGRDQKQYGLIKINKEDGTMKIELLQNAEYLPKLLDRMKEYDAKQPKLDVEKPIVNHISDISPVRDFLSGKTCLTGGTGYWKYELCYGRYVRQYHGETSLILGFFDRKAHIKWLEEHPNKRPKPIGQRKQLVHFYQGGNVCDKTGKNRETEVVLKCMDNTKSQSVLTLYLLEPQICQYILGVESPLICDILKEADDETGLNKYENVDMEQFTLDDAVVDDLNARLEND